MMKLAKLFESEVSRFMSHNTLESLNATARYDEESHLIWVTYRGVLDATASAAVYTWLEELFKTIDTDAIRGEVFDFREVTVFGPDNLMEARKKSRGFNLKMDTSQLPVALVVANFYQEEILRGPMQNVPENHRKMIVHSDTEAIEFINNWHREKA